MKNTFKILLLAIIFSYNKVLAQNDELIFNSFKQGERFNCASVALIKAAIYKYGLGKVIKYQKNTDGIHVQLKNGQELDLSDKELSAASSAAGFTKIKQDITGG